MLHFSKIQTIAKRKDKQGMPVPFSLRYVKKSTGEIIHIEQAVATSDNSKGTLNIKLLPSGQIRKLILPLVIEINNTPVFM